MAFLTESFDVDSLPKSERNFDPLPDGWYTASITGAEIKKTKAGTGEYIAVRYDITGPTHQGRVIFANLNIKNPNPKAEEIGRMELGNLMRAIGLSRVTDTDQLIGGTLSIKITISKSEQYGDGNEVKGYKSVAGSVAISPSVSTTPVAAAKSAPPWANRK